jgi:hypothetical protein
MDQFAIGVGVKTETLNNTADWRIEVAQKF